MRNVLLFTICFLISALAKAQVVLDRIEDFEVGDSMKFHELQADNLQAGEAGAGRVWDFSKISYQGNSTQTIISPAWSKFSKQIPNANMVERTSKGTYVFMYKSGDTNHITGFVDSLQNLVIKYSKPYSFINRPFTYGDSLVASYARSYIVNAVQVNGTGYSRTYADGYGTLHLPSGTYYDVIRVKFEQFSYDVMPMGDTQFVYTVSYAWFDQNLKSALMKIDSISIESKFFSHQFKEGIVLQQEYSVGIKENKKSNSTDIDVYVTQSGKVFLKVNNSTQIKAEVFSITGQLLQSNIIDVGGNHLQPVSFTQNTKKHSFVLVRVSKGRSSKTIKVFNP